MKITYDTNEPAEDIIIAAHCKTIFDSLHTINEKLRRAARGKYEGMGLEQFASMCMEEVPAIVGELEC